MRIAWMWVLALVALVTAPMAAANDASATPSLVGTWKCATSRDHMKMHVTFLANGTVVGRTSEKHLAGRYVQEGNALSITGDDEVILASSLQVASASASANLLNGDQISCHRLK